MDQALRSQAKRLGVAERVDLINGIWASIDADTVPVSPAEAALIDQRLANADAEGVVGRPWNDVETALRSRIR